MIIQVDMKLDQLHYFRVYFTLINAESQNINMLKIDKVPCLLIYTSINIST